MSCDEKFHIVFFFDEWCRYQDHIAAIKLVSNKWYVLHNFIVTDLENQVLSRILEDLSKKNLRFLKLHFDREYYRGWLDANFWKFIKGEINHPKTSTEEVLKPSAQILELIQGDKK